MHKKYKVKYKILPSKIICNALVPSEHEILRKNTFYNKLEKSILKDGFINPIMINVGFCPWISRRYLPKEMAKDSNKILVCCKWGGSRLYIAHKHNLDVPCIISDFIDRFEEQPLSFVNVQKLVTGMKEIVVTDVGLWGKV